jgi:dolichyl-phosphate beta-glucosyltransferase
LIRALVLPALNDTQCGFKLFRADVAEDLFRRQTLMGWSFDVELLYIASRKSIPMLEIPIPWYYNPESKINVWRDSWRMFVDLLTIRRNGRAGRYD